MSIWTKLGTVATRSLHELSRQQRAESAQSTRPQPSAQDSYGRGGTPVDASAQPPALPNASELKVQALNVQLALMAASMADEPEQRISYLMSAFGDLQRLMDEPGGLDALRDATGGASPISLIAELVSEIAQAALQREYGPPPGEAAAADY
jgi:hypothetical protein